MQVVEFERYLDADEAAQALDKVGGFTVAPRTLLDGARSRKVPSHKVNRRWRFRLSELLRHYEEASARA